MINKKILLIILLVFSASDGVIGISNKPIDSAKIDSLNNIFSKLKIQKGIIRGKRTEKEILEVIKNHLASIRDMYNKRLRLVPGLQGQISVRFAILSNGKTSNIRIIQSEIYDTSFTNCLLDKIKNIQFTTSKIGNDTTELIFPFLFGR